MVLESFCFSHNFSDIWKAAAMSLGEFPDMMASQSSALDVCSACLFCFKGHYWQGQTGEGQTGSSEAFCPCSSIVVGVTYLICRILTFWLFFTATPEDWRWYSLSCLKSVPMPFVLVQETAGPSPTASCHKLSLGFICIVIWSVLYWKIDSLFGL